MLDIDDHKDDPYLTAFSERREVGSASPLDRANTALLNASQAATLVGEGDETVRQEASDRVDRVALAASAVAICERNDDKALADEFARVAESEALVLDSFDYVKIDGLKRHEIHGV
jgi:hypothetical protein